MRNLESIDLAGITRPNIIIDCGHLPVLYAEGNFTFGDVNNTPTLTQYMTLSIGVEHYNSLRLLGKRVKISLCFTDTTKFVLSAENRETLVQMDRHTIFEMLPANYKELLQAKLEDLGDLEFSFQTRNSNLFTAYIKKAKNFARKSGNIEEIYARFQALFFKDFDDNCFGFTSPFILDYSDEDVLLGGDLWREDYYYINEHDTLLAPFCRIKKLGIVKLYSKTDGILCPATYAGLLLQYTDDWDHVAIYHRSDDEFIGEKLIRGVLAANCLTPQFNRNCIQIVLPKEGDMCEFSFLSSEKLRISNSISLEEFQSRIAESRLYDTYNLYI